MKDILYLVSYIKNHAKNSLTNRWERSQSFEGGEKNKYY